MSYSLTTECLRIILPYFIIAVFGDLVAKVIAVTAPRSCSLARLPVSLVGGY